MKMEISSDVAQKLLNSCNEAAGGDVSRLNGDVWSVFSDRILELLNPLYQNDGGNGNAKIMSFVGPTGVGKTTTLAKLAARYKIFDQKKIAMITIDTYRIGAVEQLKTYGEILGVPVETVLTTEEMETVLEKHRDKDVVLIDTAGRSSSDAEKITELREFLKTVGPHDVSLVLGGNTRTEDLFRYVEHFKELQYNRFIFTKLDETNVYGAILNVMHGHSVPVSYITNGQNVPDDIHKMSPRKIANLLFGGGVRQ